MRKKLLRSSIALAFALAISASVYSQTSQCDVFYTGVNHRFAGKWDEAVADLTKAIERKCPEIGKAYWMRGEARFAKKDTAGAWADATQAITLMEEPAAAHRLRGDIARSRSDYKTADVEYSQTIKLNPNDVSAYLKRADVKQLLGDKDAAIGDYTRAIALEKDASNDAYINRGYLYQQKGEPVLAMADLDKAVKIGPKDPVAFAARGHIQYLNKNYKAAILDLRNAVSFDLKYADAYHHLGHAYHDSGQMKEALGAFSRAIEIEPKKGGFYLDRALVHRDTLNFDSAGADFAKARELEPTNGEYILANAWFNLIRDSGDYAAIEAAEALKHLGMKGNGPWAVIVGYLGYKMSGDKVAATAFLKKNIRTSQPGQWTDKILKYLNGQLTSAQLLAGADDAEKKTDAHAVIGANAILDGNSKLAKTSFNWVTANIEKKSFSYFLAYALEGRYNL